MCLFYWMPDSHSMLESEEVETCLFHIYLTELLIEFDYDCGMIWFIFVTDGCRGS